MPAEVGLPPLKGEGGGHALGCARSCRAGGQGSVMAWREWKALRVGTLFPREQGSPGT